MFNQVKGEQNDLEQEHEMNAKIHKILKSVSIFLLLLISTDLFLGQGVVSVISTGNT